MPLLPRDPLVMIYLSMCTGDRIHLKHGPCSLC